ncbi:MAG: FlgD immunoglobulin-like domain containing protein [Armatimonadota bacterium]
MRHSHARLILTMTAAGIITLFCAGAYGSGANPFRNVSNVPFHTTTSGPQGAVVVRDSAPGTVNTSALQRAVQTQHSSESLAGTQVTLQRLKQAGVVAQDAEVRFPRTVVHMRDGEMVLPDLTDAAVRGKQIGDPTNTLEFEFEGFSSQDEQAFRSYLDTAIPKARMVYGPPAFDITVTVIQDDSIEAIQGGTYDVTTNEIRIAPPTGNFPEDTYILLMLALNAFHDDAILYYDTWEQGFIGAAAYVVQTMPGVSSSYDPIDPGPFYALSVYEAENQPELANPTFYPDSGSDNMLVWRIAMARAAWLKCYIEDNEFFKNFNTAYYANYNDTLPGDVPALKVLAEQVLPRVEGRPFFEWFERNYVLDTSIHLGPKLYVWNIPLEQSMVLIAELYTTLPGGDEQVDGGTARTTYWSYDFSTKLYAEEGNVIDIPGSGSDAGEGFLLPTFFNIGGPQRVTVEMEVNGLFRSYPYPYGERGFEAGENNLYGSVQGATKGTIDVVGGGGMSDVEVKRGVWGGRITSGRLSPMQIEVTFENDIGQTVVRTFNIGWGSYVTFLNGSEQTRVSHTFEVGANGLQMMTLPMWPAAGSTAEILNVDPDRLLMADWDPTKQGEDKYSIYPDIRPFAPARAFWLKLSSDATVDTLGIVPPSDEGFTESVPIGWNMIGSPRQEAVQLGDLQVSYEGSDPVPFSEAVNNGWVQADIFGYTPGAGYEIADSMEPFTGYWLRVLRSPAVHVTFPATTDTEQVSAEKAVEGDNLEWKLPLVVQAGPYVNQCAYLGAARDATEGADPAYDLLAPPDFGDHVKVRFALPGERLKNASWATDVRPENGEENTWNLQVSSTYADTPVTLRWPDLSRLPSDLRPVLINRDTGQRRYMRTTTHITLPADADGCQSNLAIEMNEDTGASLSLTGLSTAQTGAGAAITYNLSKPASVRATVRNIAGRTVARIADGSVQPAGSGNLMWNLRNTTGSLVPSGVYLISVTARSDDGQQTSVLRTFSLTR